MNGSNLARLAYLKDEKWVPYGHVVYFRSHDVRIRLSTIPVWAMANNVWTLGQFCEQFKVEEPPYLSGDIIVKDKDEGEIKLGRLETYQNSTGDVTFYQVFLNALPAAKTVKAMQHAELDKKYVWMDVKLEDK